MVEQSTGFLASIKCPNQNVSDILEPITKIMSRRLLCKRCLLSGTQQHCLPKGADLRSSRKQWQEHKQERVGHSYLPKSVISLHLTHSRRGIKNAKTLMEKANYEWSGSIAIYNRKWQGRRLLASFKEETTGPLQLIILWACGTFDVRSSNFSKQTRVSNLETQSLNL